MKRFILLYIFTILAIPLLAQLEVLSGSFKEVLGFVNISLDKQTDINNQPYSIIKVTTQNINDRQRRELLFQGDAATFIECEYKVGEVWLYITYKATYLKISHPDLSTTEFWFPFDMQPKKCYELTLVNKSANATPGSGSLSIKTKPEQDATITLNGKLINYKTPYVNDVIAAGYYEITVSKERYKSVTRTVTVNDGDKITVEIEMPIDVATITLSADSDTEVFIDGISKQKGTWIGELYSGSHQIIYKKPSHSDAVDTIQVIGGKSRAYQLQPTPIYGGVNVSTEPSGATIRIDDKKYGTTPNIIGNILIGQHTLQLDKSGYKTIRKSIKVSQGDTLILSETLKTAPKPNKSKTNNWLSLNNDDIDKYGYFMFNLQLNTVKNQTYWGISVGAGKKFGGYLDLDSTFDFTSMEVTLGASYILYQSFALKIGIGYNYSWEKIDDVIMEDSFITASVGFLYLTDNFAFSIDIVPVNTFEIRFGIGFAY